MVLEENFMVNNKTYSIHEYNELDLSNLLNFFEKCLSESGRVFKPESIHNSLLHVEIAYDKFIYIKEQESGQIIGTCALKMMSKSKCELKCVYLYQEFHGLGLGTKMSQIIIYVAKEMGYKQMYLDTISSTSSKAIKMYERLGFIKIEKYHETIHSDVFMMLNLE